MKKTIYISLLILCVVSFVGVSCAAAKVPAATMNYEKAVLSTSVDLSANSDGAIVCHPVNMFPVMEMFEPMACAKCVYVVDETFYRNGYRAKLSKAVKEIIVPPDHTNKPVSIPLKLC